MYLHQEYKNLSTHVHMYHLAIMTPTWDVKSVSAIRMSKFLIVQLSNDDALLCMNLCRHVHMVDAHNMHTYTYT